MSTLGGLFGPDGVIHGTYTLKGPNGDYETIDTQYGKAGSVSEGSITVTSADGYVQVYAVDSSTVVDADSSGITSVNNGDTVTVTATVSGDTATAQTVIDLTQVQANRKSWAPGGPKGLVLGEARPPRPSRRPLQTPPHSLPLRRQPPGRARALPGQAVDERGSCCHGAYISQPTVASPP